MAAFRCALRTVGESQGTAQQHTDHPRPCTSYPAERHALPVSVQGMSAYTATSGTLSAACGRISFTFGLKVGSRAAACNM